MRERTVYTLVAALLLLTAVGSGCRRSPRRWCCALAPRAAPVADPPAAEAESPPKGSVESALVQKRIRGLNWLDADLSQAVTYLRTITGIEFVISPRVMADKFEDILITLQLDDVDVRTVLDLITAPYGLRWEVRDGVVHLLTVDEVDGAIVVQIHDVRDLVGEDGSYVSASQVEHDVRTHVYPKYWDRDGAGLATRGGSLVVRASEAVQDAVAEHLASARALIITPRFEPDVRKKLEATKVNLLVEDQTLADVVKMLQIQTGMNIVIDPRFGYAFNDRRIIGLKLTEVALSTVLRIVAEAAGEDAVFVGKGNVIVLTRREHVGR